MVQKTVFSVRRVSGGSSRITEFKNFVYHVNPTYKRQLIAQPCELKRSVEGSYSFSGANNLGDNSGLWSAVTDPCGPYGLNVSSNLSNGAYNKAYGSFVKKIRNSDASLGVTLASYNKTRDMVAERATKLARLAERMASDKRVHGLSRGDFLQASFTGRGVGRAARHIASNHLEYIFGWVPLYKDLIAVTNTLAGMTLPPVWVTGTGRVIFINPPKADATFGGQYVRASDGVIRCTLGALVEVTNPNLYLANRLGLANLPGVAWDLVPWSFVVNMFGNFNQVISSFADFAGLKYSQVSTTYTYKGVSTAAFAANASHSNPKLTAQSSTFNYEKRRVLTSTVPRPRLVLSLPNVSGGLIGIASSLLVQKFGSLGKLLR